MLLGEFGAYDKADMDSRARYTAAVARAAERLGWSWAYWQFDSDFVVYDIGKDAWVEPLREGAGSLTPFRHSERLGGPDPLSVGQMRSSARPLDDSRPRDGKQSDEVTLMRPRTALPASGTAAALLALALATVPASAFCPSHRSRGSGAREARETAAAPAAAVLRLNELEYLEMPGLNVMLAHDYYPEGHQGGVGIIQNGLRVATNGDIRLDRTPGQWQPVPKVGKRVVDKATGEISLRAEYPDESKNRKGFNPVDYPDLRFAYTVRVRPEGQAFRILVDLEQAAARRVGRQGRLQHGALPRDPVREDLRDGDSAGIFPRQANGPGTLDAKGEYQIAPLASGKRLVIAPESDRQRMAIEDVTGGGLELVDGRGQHNNGWFVVRSLVAEGATKGAVEWLVTPHALPGFTAAPTVQVSQVGYHPKQQKWAIVETDPRDTRRLPVVVSRITGTGALEKAMEARPLAWGRFLRYDYLRLDFTAVEKPGMYVVSYGDARSNPFRIGADVYQRHVWQPTVESFLPIQMCHVRVNERYRVWHDACHLDDARMAPVEPQPLRRLPAGSLDARRSTRRASRYRGSTAAGGTTRGTTTCASSRRRRRCTASRSRGRRSGPSTTTPRSTRSSVSSRCTSPTASRTCSSRSSTAR